MQLQIAVISDVGTGKVLSLAPGDVVIGRDNAGNLQIPDEFVSLRQRARAWLTASADCKRMFPIGDRRMRSADFRDLIPHVVENPALDFVYNVP